MSDILLEYDGKVTDDGTLILPGRKIRAEVVVFAGKEIEVTIRKKRKGRGDPQNRFYWGIVVEMTRLGFRDLGERFTREEVHDILKCKFLKRQKTDETTGEVLYEYLESTTRLTTVEFIDYIEECSRFAAEFLGVAIPEP